MMNGNGAPPGPPDDPHGTSNGKPPLSRSFSSDRKRITPEISQQMDRAAIGAWVLYACDPERKKFQCQGFLLTNKNADEPLDHFVVGKGLTHVERQAAVEQLVQRFHEASWEDACGYPFKQSYRILAQLTDDPHGEPYVSKPFVVTPPPEAAEGFAERQGRSSSTGELDPKAVIGDLQRLLDRRMTLDAENTQALLDRMADAEQRARDREERIAADREKLWLDRERLLSEQADRESKNYAQRIEAEAYGQLVGGALKYGSAFANMFMEQKFGGGMAGQMQKLADTLEPAQFYMMMTLMNPTQKEAMRPFAEKIVMSWPEDKRLAFAAAHEEYEKGKTQQLAAQTAPSGPPAPPPPPTTTSTPAPGDDPEWRALGYQSEQEYAETVALLAASAQAAKTDSQAAEPAEPDRGTVVAAPAASSADPVTKPAAANVKKAARKSSKRKT